MGRLFGTDGVRGRAGTELTADLATRLGRAAVLVLGRHGGGRPSVIVGRDPRVSGVWLQEALVDGIVGAGGDALLAGVEPTPAIAFTTVDRGASAGAVISASHNPAEDNGIKFFSRDGHKLPDAVEDEIEAALDGVPASEGPPGDIGSMRCPRRLRRPSDGGGDRAAGRDARGGRLRERRRLARSLPPSSHASAPTCIAIHAEPDGRNINVGCGALHPEVVAAEVVRAGADAGVSPRRRRRPRAVRRRGRPRDRRGPGARGVRDGAPRRRRARRRTPSSPP